MIYIVGIGPGNSLDYLTVKAYKCLQESDVGIYIGEMIGKDIKKIFTGKILHVGRNISKDKVIETIKFYNKQSNQIALMMPGDISIYSGQHEEQYCLGDYIRLFTDLNLEFELIPGISSWTAINSKLNIDFTKFSSVQNIYTTSIERLIDLKQFDKINFELVLSTKPNLVLFQSFREWKYLKYLIEQYYPPDTRIVFAYKLSWEEELIIDTTLKNVEKELEGKKISKHTLILILP